MNTLQRRSAVLCLIVLIVQSFSLLGIINRGNRDFVGNIVETTAFWLVYTLCEYIYKLKIHYYIRLAVVISIISDGLFGFYFNLYIC